jgi:sugar lactone lactonase YvrE
MKDGVVIQRCPAWRRWLLLLIPCVLLLASMPLHAALLCEADVTAQVQVTRGGFRYNRGQDRFVQEVTVKALGAPITGPLVLALDGLSGNANLDRPSGTTHCLSPLGSPTATVTNGTLASGVPDTVPLSFIDSSQQGITYTARVLRLVPSTITQILPSSLSLSTGATDALAVSVAPAPGVATGLSVTSSRSAVVSVPATVSIPPGASRVDIPLTARAPGSATITATLNGSSVHSAIEVRDATPPVVTLVSAPNDPTNDRTLAVTVRATDNVTPPSAIQYAFSLDAGAYSNYGAASKIIYMNVPDGRHTIQAKARDQAGNESLPLAISLHVDTQPPVLIISEPTENAVVTDPTLPIRGSATDQSAVTVSVHGQTVPVRSGTFVATADLRAGMNSVRIEAVDAAGNRTSITRHVRLEDLSRIDAPVAPVLAAAGLPELSDLAVTPDGTVLASAPHAGDIYLLAADGGVPRVYQSGLRQPRGMAIAPDGPLYVAEEAAGRIVRIDPDGSRRVILDGVEEPRGAALGRNSSLYITARRWRGSRWWPFRTGVVLRLDLSSGAVMVLTEDLVRPEGILATSEGDEDVLWVVAERQRRVGEFRGDALFKISVPAGAIPVHGPTLWRPAGLGRDGLAMLWLAARRQLPDPDLLPEDDSDEWSRGAILRVTPEGNWYRFAHNLDEPRGVAFAANGDLLVIEPDRGRVLRFRAPPVPRVDPPNPSGLTVSLAGSADRGSLVVAQGPAGKASVLAAAEGQFQIALPLLPNQANQIEVFAVGQAGNGLASAPARLTIATTAPLALAVDSPTQNALTNGTLIQVRGSVSGGSAPIHVSVNGAPAPVDASGNFVIALPLSEGSNNIMVLARDAAAIEQSLTRTVVLDTTPPTVIIASPVEGAVLTGTSVSVTGTVSDLHPAPTVTINGQAAAVNASGQFALDLSLPLNQTTVSVLATDQAGNSRALTRTIVRDATAPVLSIISAPPNPTNNRTLTLTVSATDNVTQSGEMQYAFALDGEPYSGYGAGASATYTNVADGTHTLRAKAKDRAGNESAPQSVTVQVDTAPPQVVVSSPAANFLTSAGEITVVGTVADASAISQVTVNGQVAAVSGNSFRLVLSLSEGSNTITAVAQDAAGNSGSATVNGTRDSTPPGITVTSPTDGFVTKQATVSVTGTVVDAGAIAQVTVNGQPAVVMAGGFSAAVTLNEGRNTITVAATDAAGNSRTVSVAGSLDTLPPAVTITAPVPNFLTNASQITVTGSVSDASAVSQISINGQPITVSGSGFSAVVNLAEGPNTITVVAQDAAANQGTATVSGTRDSIAPIISISAPSGGFLTNTASILVSGTVADVGGIGSVAVNGQNVGATGGAFSCMVSLTEGQNTITVTAVDPAGNTGTGTVSGVLDTIPPAITITAPATNLLTNQASIAVAGTVLDASAITSLTVNGQPASVTGGAFTAPVVLVRGANTITITARDAAGNESTARRTATLDDVAPVIRILTPARGQIVSQTSLTITGTVDDPTAQVTVNGQPAPVSGTSFSATIGVAQGQIVITATAQDPAGNIGSDQVGVIVDTTPPTITRLDAPAEVAAGAVVSLAVEAMHPLGLTVVDLAVDGRLVASGPASPLAASFTIPPDHAMGDVLSVSARAVNVAGLAVTSVAEMKVTAAAAGPGYLRGLVLDDVKGLPLAGATVAVSIASGGSPDPQVTGEDGQYAFSLEPGTALVRVTLPASTTVERKVAVRSDLLSTASDARLTPRDPSVSVIGQFGGVATDQGNAYRLSIAPGALGLDTSIGITPVSAQGLIARLPLGWTPIVAADILPDTLSLTMPATLSVRLPDGLASMLQSGSPIALARYDGGQGAWVTLDPGTVTSDGLAVEAALTSGGQVAFLLPDSMPQAPPAASVGQLLGGVSTASLPDDAVATGSVSPDVIPPGQTTATGGIIVAPSAPLPSGTAVKAVVTERYTLTTGEQVNLPGFAQDLVLYQCPATSEQCPTNGLKTSFPVTPSKSYTLKDLVVGAVHLDVQTADTGGQGTIIGPEGGTLAASDGTILVIPAGALAHDTVVVLTSVAESDLRVAVPAGFRVLKSVNLDLTRATLSLSAELAFPLPAGITGESQVLVARVLTVDGVLKLQAVGTGQVSGGLLSSRGTVTGLSLPGITSGGTYIVMLATTAVGFVAGTITDTGNTAKAGVLVSSSTGMVDVSRADGRYLLATAAGNATVVARDRATGQGATQTLNIPTGGSASQSLQVQVIPPTVVAVNPVSGATRVPVSTQVSVTFSQTINKATLTQTTLMLSGPNGVVDAVITLSPLGTEATLYPAKALAAQTTYTLVASQSILDTHGTPLVTAFSSQFTTTNPPPPPPAAGNLSVSFPDENGNVTVTATQGTAAPDNLVVVLNTDSGALASATVRGDGSFQAMLYAVLGDELLVIIKDKQGGQSVVSAGAYVGPDGQTIVTSAGGTVPVPGGGNISLEPRTVRTPSSIKLTSRMPQDLTISLPSGYRVVSGVKLDTQSAFASGAKLSLPFPSSMTLDTNARPFLATQQTIAGENVLVMVDSMRVWNGALTTSSPPFDGVMGLGDYFAIVPPVPIPALVTGTVTTTMPDGTITPVPGAIIRAGTNPQVALTRSDGTYALYVYPTALVPQVITLTATEPSTRIANSASVNMTSWIPSAIQRYTQDFGLPGGVVLMDRTPPNLTLTLTGDSVQGALIGLGSAVTVTVTAADKKAIDPGSIALTLDGQSIQIGPDFTRPGAFMAAFVASAVAKLSTLEATAVDTNGNVGRITKRIQSVDMTAIPMPVPGQEPEVVGIEPDEDAKAVNVFDVMTITFSEPVQNYTAETIFLTELKPGGKRIPLTYKADYADFAKKLTVIPQRNLDFNTRYRLTVTTDITDLDNGIGTPGIPLKTGFTREFTTIALKKVGDGFQGANIRAVELLENGRIAVLDRLDGLRVLDVRDPQNIKLLGNTEPLWGGYAYHGFQGMSVLRGFTYVTAAGRTVTTDVAVVVGYSQAPESGLQGHLAVVSLGQDGALQRLGTALLGTDSTSSPMMVLATDPYALVGSVGAGLQVVDLPMTVAITQQYTGGPLFGTETTAAPVVGGFDFGGLPLPAPVGIVRSGKTPNIAYVGERARGVFWVNLAALPGLSPTPVDYGGGTPFRIGIAEEVPQSDGTTIDYLLVATTTGLKLVRIPVEPGEAPAVTTVDFGQSLAGIFGLAAHGPRGLAFLNAGNEGLIVVDIKSQTPSVIGRQTNVGYASGGLTFDDRYAYVAAGSNGLQIVQYDPAPIELTIFDALAFEPFGRDGRLQGFRYLPASDVVTPSYVSVREGALADGASLLVLRVTVPSYGKGSDPVKLRLTFTLSEPDGNDQQPATPATVGSLHDGMGDWKFFPDPNVDVGPLQVTIEVPTTPKAGGIGAIIYRPPAEFVRGYDDERKIARSVRVAMTFDPAQVRSSGEILVLKEATELKYSGNPLNMRFSLVRPPLVLVHGILSGPDAWLDFSTNFRSLFPGAFIYAPADYRERSSSGFATIYTAVRDTIQRTLGYLRQGSVPLDRDYNPKNVLKFRRIAASRVDLLAHSQGGLATRYYLGRSAEFRRSDNYFYGDLRRIITVGTPFKGAAIANWVVRGYRVVESEPGRFEKQWIDRNESDLIWQIAKEKGGKFGDMLAFRDLTPGSDTQHEFEEDRDFNPRLLEGPLVHTIRAYSEGASPAPEIALWVLKFFGLGAQPLDGQFSDQIVCVQSQMGAIPDNARAVSEMYRVTHTQETSSPQLAIRIGELLNQRDGVTQFDGRGMPPSGNIPDLSQDFTCQ